jgi:hypothetical protein
MANFVLRHTDAAQFVAETQMGWFRAVGIWKHRRAKKKIGQAGIAAHSPITKTGLMAPSS